MAKVRSASAQPLRSADRLLQVFESFSIARPQRTLTEISQELDLAASTVRRLLLILQQRGILEIDQTTGRYSVALAAERLIAPARAAKLNEVSAVALAELRERTGETVILSLPDGHESVHVQVLPGTHLVSVFNPIGSRLHLYDGFAIGQVLLAWLSDAELDRILPGRSWERRTSRSFATASALRRELAVVRTKGYAINDRRSEADVWAVAAPVRSITGAVDAAACVVMPYIRHTPKIERALISAIVETAEVVTNHWREALANATTGVARRAAD